MSYKDCEADDGEIRAGTSNFVLKVLIKNVKEIKKLENTIIIVMNHDDMQFHLYNKSDEIANVWHEALVLINPEVNPNIKCFIECLVDIQLLDMKTLGIAVPQKMPPVPPMPLDFDFCA